MERSPVITWLFHIRAVGLFALLLLVDYLFVKHSWSTLQTKGFSVDIVFGLEVSTSKVVIVIAISFPHVVCYNVPECPLLCSPLHPAHH